MNSVNDYRAEKVRFHKIMDDGRKVYCGTGTRLVRKIDGQMIVTVIGPATRTQLYHQYVKPGLRRLDLVR